MIARRTPTPTAPPQSPVLATRLPEDACDMRIAAQQPPSLPHRTTAAGAAIAHTPAAPRRSTRCTLAPPGPHLPNCNTVYELNHAIHLPLHRRLFTLVDLPD